MVNDLNGNAEGREWHGRFERSAPSENPEAEASDHEMAGGSDTVQHGEGLIGGLEAAMRLLQELRKGVRLQASIICL